MLAKRDSTGSPQARADTPGRLLTKREQQVLCLISQGYSSRITADMMFISKRTVGFHLGNIYRKLSVHNRAQALIQARHLNLL